MWKFSFITINAVITEGNGYRRDMEFCDQIKNEPTAKLKKKWTPCVHIQTNICAITVLKNFNIPIPDNI